MSDLHTFHRFVALKLGLVGIKERAYVVGSTLSIALEEGEAPLSNRNAKGNGG